MNALITHSGQTQAQNRLLQLSFVDYGIRSMDVIPKITLAVLLLILSAGCSTLTGTQQTAEMEFCWERGMNFTWIDEYDAGCIQPNVNSVPMRISKIKWLEEGHIGFSSLTRLTNNTHSM
ncbi:MAG: hypothetical protein ACI8Z1_003080 [Candidatus Azotimanducaceae bacterium]|jgi:hypothetical protein